MKTTVSRVTRALEQRLLRHYVDAIERNPATSGEVVIWAYGMGYPVYSCAQAVKVALRAKSTAEAI